MHWNHRVVKKVYENGEIQLGIHEVHYNDDNSINGYTINPKEACIVGSSDDDLLENLREYISWMQRALDKPILIDGEVEFKHDPIEDKIDEIMRAGNVEDIEKLLDDLESKLE